jgi:TonB family protein
MLPRLLHAMKPVTYSGYTTWPDGLSVWPKRKLVWQWAALSGIRSGFAGRGEGIDTVFAFGDGRTLALRGARVFSFGSGPGRFAELVAQAVAAAPATADIDELTFEIAQWGPRDVRRRFKTPIRSAEGPKELLERARHHRVWLERSKSLQFVEAALRQHPADPAALQLRHQLMLEKGDAKGARQTAEDWLAWYPLDPQAQEALLRMRLGQNECGAGEEARRFLEGKAGHYNLAADLAAYYFRSGDYGEAATWWGRVAATAPNPLVRQQARQAQDYADKTGRDALFRWREKLLRWAKLTLAWGSLAVAVGFQGVRIYELFTRKEREQQRRQEMERAQHQWQEAAKEQLDAMDRQFTEMTGRVMGDYVAVRARADRGEPAAQLTVAEMLFEGAKGAPKDPVAALDYLERAAAQGHRAALLSLGQSLVEGKKLPKDTARAAALFEQAMEKDSPRAAAELAELYQKGDGVEQDKAKAFTLYAKAAEGGYVYAMTQAGWMLEQGEGVAADRAGALEYYRRAADKKSEWATERLVRLLAAPTSSAEEQSEARQWLKVGARRGSSSLRLQAAAAVLSGWYVDDELQQEARAWLAAAVAARQPGAATQQGLCFLYGWGLEQDFLRARQSFETEQATDQVACSQLARCLAFGVGGPRDIARARQLQGALSNPAYQRWLEPYLTAAEAAAENGPPNRPLFQAPPEYPTMLSRRGVEGEATIRFAIDADGFTRNVEVVSATYPEFGHAARLAVACWRFHPSANDITAARQVTIEFKLEKERTQAN